ncbi:MAG TPA: SRPBCC family protein [Flavisolibacter sp.]|jgi:ligand-binding SRPBCC domain-containing protein|nr:SRPBCC family protein [Flavisolibacter sp.]
MPVIKLETYIKAPLQVVFDLSRSVDVHQTSMKHHNEKVIDGVKTGLMSKGDTVTWQASHLFQNRKLKVKITEMEAPVFFADEMLEGDFKKMRHEHYFKATGEQLLMTDKFYFETPFGFIGKLADTLFLKNYMTRLLLQRNAEIKRLAEASFYNEILNLKEDIK